MVVGASATGACAAIGMGADVVMCVMSVDTGAAGATGVCGAGAIITG